MTIDGTKPTARHAASEATHLHEVLATEIAIGGPSAAAEELVSERGDQLGTRAARGTVITLAGQATQVLLQMTSVVVLARLLSPHDYGLYAIVVTIVGIGEIFRDFGLSSAAIQAKILTDGQRNNLFWLNSAIGCTLALILFLCAPLIGDLFGQPDLVAISRALSLTFVMNGIATQFRANLNRQMRFGMLALSDLVGMVFGVGVGIACAAAGASYWALVGSQLAQVGAVMTMVIVMSRWLPGRPDRSADVRHFLKYGWSFFGAQLVSYASGNVDSMTIALRFGPKPLGIYNRAFALLMSPINQIRIPATTIALPVLSRLQDDDERAGRYLRTGQITLGYTIVAGLTIVIGASKPIVDLFLGSQWHQVVPIMTLLAVAASMQFLSFIGYWAYISRGLTGPLFRYSLISLSITVVCIITGSNWGIVGVAAGYAIAPTLAWPVSLWWLNRTTVVPVGALYRGAARILSMATCGSAAAFLASRSLTGTADILQILAAVGAVLAVYALAGLLVPLIRHDLDEVAGVVRRVFR
jgi:PST family polysaccharide transporter